MFKKSKEKSKIPTSVPSYDNECYITTDILKALTNGEYITLKKVICEKGTYEISDSVCPSSRLHLCRYDRNHANVFKTTSVKYVRDDGKPEETRLDKLFEVK